MNSRKALAAFGLFVGGVLVIAACDGIANLGTIGAGVDSLGASSISDGRKNASRNIENCGGLPCPPPFKNVLVYLAQMPSPVPPGPPFFNRCLPFGGPGFAPWPVIVASVFQPFRVSPPNGPSEYDFVGTFPGAVDNEICLGMRVPVEPTFPLQFTQVEFNLRSVCPHAYGHAPGIPYEFFPGPPAIGQADFPSNDPDLTRRSLFNRAGGDVVVWIQGLDFVGAPAVTNAYMNTLGPTGWVLFMRDNAYRSGRFYNILGALKGAPRAFADTPSLADDGFFESVQVNGDNFDSASEPFGNIDPAALSFCGVVNPLRPYAFLDRSNFAETGASPFLPDPGAGQGGFMLVIHSEAFAAAQVVVNPNVPGPLPAPVLAGDLFGPPPSGYDSTVLPGIAGPDRRPRVDGPAGIHELGFSVFFIHGS